MYDKRKKTWRDTLRSTGLFMFIFLVILLTIVRIVDFFVSTVKSLGDEE